MALIRLPRRQSMRYREADIRLGSSSVPASPSIIMPIGQRLAVQARITHRTVQRSSCPALEPNARCTPGRCDQAM
jgi:hypothetical protein